MYMGYDIYPTLHGNPPRAIVSPFLKSAKKTHLGKGATMHASNVGEIRIGWSSNRGHKALEIWGRSPNRGRIFPRSFKPPPFLELKLEKGWGFLGGGSASPSLNCFLEFRTSNRLIWCILEWEILKNWLFQRKHRETFKTNELNWPPLWKLCPKLGVNEILGVSGPSNLSHSLPPVVASLHSSRIWTINSKITFQHWVTFRYVAFPGKQWKYGSYGKIWPPGRNIHFLPWSYCA